MDHLRGRAAVDGQGSWGANDYGVFWLIGTEHFYGNPGIDVDGKIGRPKKQFIETAQKVLTQAPPT
ncbi:MAG TPA: hypothetical protein VIZ60_11730 [Rubrobacter sp.]